MRFDPWHLLVAILVALAVFAPRAHAVDATVACTASKLQRAGELHLCLLNDAARILRGRPSQLAKCEAKFMAGWAKAETKANGACRTAGDEAALKAQVTAQAVAIFLALNPPVTTTSTTIPSGPACGQWPGCGGSCPAGSSCWATITAGPTQSCTCLPETATSCAASGGPALSGPTCGGACPAGQVCATLDIEESLSSTCACIPAGATPCISSGAPACGGTCPAGLTCGTGALFPCLCQ